MNILKLLFLSHSKNLNAFSYMSIKQKNHHKMTFFKIPFSKS